MRVGTPVLVPSHAPSCRPAVTTRHSQCTAPEPDAVKAPAPSGHPSGEVLPSHFVYDAPRAPRTMTGPGTVFRPCRRTILRFRRRKCCDLGCVRGTAQPNAADSRSAGSGAEPPPLLLVTPADFLRAQWPAKVADAIFTIDSVSLNEAPFSCAALCACAGRLGTGKRAAYRSAASYATRRQGASRRCPRRAPWAVGWVALPCAVNARADGNAAHSAAWAWPCLDGHTGLNEPQPACGPCPPLRPTLCSCTSGSARARPAAASRASARNETVRARVCTPVSVPRAAPPKQVVCIRTVPAHGGRTDRGRKCTFYTHGVRARPQRSSTRGMAERARPGTDTHHGARPNTPHTQHAQNACALCNSAPSPAASWHRGQSLRDRGRLPRLGAAPTGRSSPGGNWMFRPSGRSSPGGNWMFRPLFAKPLPAFSSPNGTKRDPMSPSAPMSSVCPRYAQRRANPQRRDSIPSANDGVRIPPVKGSGRAMNLQRHPKVILPRGRRSDERRTHV